jgi:hypothetical protein
VESEQLGAAQTPASQAPLVQSAPFVQARPSVHLPQSDPPQSTSVSAPLTTPSAQPWPWQSPLVQTCPSQSVPAVQTLPAAHAGQSPPQSTSVSLPFCTVSVHVAAAQAALKHTWVSQSVRVEQPWPTAHAGHRGPPQSVSVSSPFIIESVHELEGGASTALSAWVPLSCPPASSSGGPRPLSCAAQAEKQAKKSNDARERLCMAWTRLRASARRSHSLEMRSNIPRISKGDVRS